jgi:hypothetical protein
MTDKVVGRDDRDRRSRQQERALNLRRYRRNASFEKRRKDYARLPERAVLLADSIMLIL